MDAAILERPTRQHILDRARELIPGLRDKALQTERDADHPK